MTKDRPLSRVTSWPPHRDHSSICVAEDRAKPCPSNTPLQRQLVTRSPQTNPRPRCLRMKSKASGTKEPEALRALPHAHPWPQLPAPRRRAAWQLGLHPARTPACAGVGCGRLQPARRGVAVQTTRRPG